MTLTFATLRPFTDHGLHTYYAVLFIAELTTKPYLIPSDFADRYRLNRALLTALTSKLCSLDFIDRYTTEDDRRQIRSKLTPTGRAFAETCGLSITD